MTASAPAPNLSVSPVVAPAGPGWRLWRLAAVLMLGFASGLPLALTGQAMQAWLSLEGIDVATIGFLSLVGLPYTFKFLWAPLMDRFDPPWLGRRRGWLVLTQLAQMSGLLVDPNAGQVPPQGQLPPGAQPGQGQLPPGQGQQQPGPPTPMMPGGQPMTPQMQQHGPAV